MHTTTGDGSEYLGVQKSCFQELFVWFINCDLLTLIDSFTSAKLSDVM